MRDTGTYEFCDVTCVKKSPISDPQWCISLCNSPMLRDHLNVKEGKNKVCDICMTEGNG